MEFYGIDPSDLPGELRAALEKAAGRVTRDEMIREDISHREQEFFDGLTEDQLVTARILFYRSSAESTESNFLQGYITGLLRTRYHHCACGKDHTSTEALGDINVTDK